MNAAEELVDRLDHRALPGLLTNVEQLVTEHAKHRLRGLEHLLWGRRHNRQGATGRADHAARDGRIQEIAAGRDHFAR